MHDVTQEASVIRVCCEATDRSEHGMIDPVRARLDRLPGVILVQDFGAKVEFVILAGDRRETVRRALDYHERGVRIVHLGSGVRVDALAENAHYDHRYRSIIESLASLRLPIESDVGPTQIDDLPDTDKRPYSKPYRFVAMNPLPWMRTDLPDLPTNLPVYAANPNAKDPGYDMLVHDMICRNWIIQPILRRRDYLSLLRHAEDVWGNSSALCYEAPLWHDDSAIHLHGTRNLGRRIVRWNVERDGHPADNACQRIEAWCRATRMIASTALAQGE